MNDVSGDCVRCGLPVKLKLAVPGAEVAVLPLTGEPLCRGCAKRQGLDIDVETLSIHHRSRYVVRTFRKGRSMDLQILDHISSGVPFDDKKPRRDGADHGKGRNRMGRYRHRYVEDPKLVATIAATLAGDLEASVVEAVELLQIAERTCAGIKAERVRGEALAERPPLDLPELRASARAFFENDVLGVHGAGPLADLVEQAQDESNPDRQVEALSLMLMVAGHVRKTEVQEDGTC